VWVIKQYLGLSQPFQQSYPKDKGNNFKGCVKSCNDETHIRLLSIPRKERKDVESSLNVGQ